MQDGYILKREELVTRSLRALYERNGYKKYRMGKFEPYELYLENINFLGSRHIITFNDLDGRVLALKPDVTLSIVKNTHADLSSSEKFYYLESVYRLDKGSRSYREISQLGLEYLGVSDAYATGEVTVLAAKTLRVISENSRMQLSHVGFVQSLMDGLSIDVCAKRALVECLRKKSAHELAHTADAMGIPVAAKQMLLTLCNLSGPFHQTIESARAIAITQGMTDALCELNGVYAMLEMAGVSENVMLDFSLLGDMDYYSGIAFQGYVQGVASAVLAGGCYAGLVKKFAKDIDAIGFAVYLNELSQLDERNVRDDVDVLVIYDASDAPVDITRAANKLNEKGLRTRFEMCAPRDLRYGKSISLKEALIDA